MESQLLCYHPPNSSFDPTFWEELYHRKLNVYRLSTDSVPISAEFVPPQKDHGSFRFTRNSFSSMNSMTGELLNVNKVEDFSSMDKKKLLKDAGQKIITAIVNGEAIRNPSLLNTFILLTFADLKSYKFIFWYGQPAISLTNNNLKTVSSTIQPFQSLTDQASMDTGKILRAIYSHLFTSRNTTAATATILPTPPTDSLSLQSPFPPSPSSPGHSSSLPTILVINLATYQVTSTLQDNWSIRYDANQLLYVIPDESSHTSAFGWSARNLITLLTVYQPLPQSQEKQQQPATINLLGLRNGQMRRYLQTHHSAAFSTSLGQVSVDIEACLADDVSIYATVTLPPLPPSSTSTFSTSSLSTGLALLQDGQDDSTASYTITGWELNDRNKPGPRVADMKSTLDTRLLMSQAVDLNLRLMKWRLWPSLKLDTLSATSVLLLGSGTLGCSVARTLMGYGIKHLTFLDYGRVSYSNPVRQSLFEYEDCLSQKKKALAAAERVGRIYPGMQETCRGVVMSIPMPGHPYTTSAAGADGQEGEQEEFMDESARLQLDQLIQQHDVIFNLTDSREARWLPTVIAKRYNKLMINAALGFDSYLVMHHGTLGEGTEGEKMGCYFCSDIVAAANSQKDRTLDEQCTVTRPGLSNIASALAVEMMVAILQQRQALQSKNAGGDEADLTNIQYTTGVIPHQIRGNVLAFEQILLECPAFPMCTACSPAVINAYVADPSGFVQAVCENPKILEEISGVKAMIEEVDVNLCIDSDEEF